MAREPTETGVQRCVGVRATVIFDYPVDAAKSENEDRPKREILPMESRIAFRIAWGLGAPLLLVGSVRAQNAAPEDEAINTIRQLTQINDGDQRRIGDWVQAQVDKLAATPDAGRQAAAVPFRKTFKTQYENVSNSPAFKAQLAAQTATIAAAQFVNPNLDQWVAYAIARVLVDMGGVETSVGLLAGLKSKHEPARFLCAEGLSAQKTAIAADKAKLDEVVQALKAAGLFEKSPIVLGRIYLALANPNQVPAVLDAYLAILEKRLTDRRGGAVMADGAEVEAFEFFRNPIVLSAVTQAQKEQQLVRLLAVLLRADAERYGTTGLDFYEVDRLERMMDSAEAILVELVGQGRGGKIRDEIAAGGQDRRAEVLVEAYKWVGHAQSKEPGVLNVAPWNVAIGAP